LKIDVIYIIGSFQHCRNRPRYQKITYEDNWQQYYKQVGKQQFGTKFCTLESLKGFETHAKRLSS
jgi:hypothetical protein